MEPIVIVDDEPSLTRLMKMALEDSGKYAVHVENDPRRAVDLIRNVQPKAVVLDIIMPHMTGLELATELSETEDLCQIPIVFLSAAVDKEDPSMWQSGLDEISFKVQNATYQSCPSLSKPVSEEELEAVLDQVIQ